MDREVGRCDQFRADGAVWNSYSDEAMVGVVGSVEIEGSSDINEQDSA